MCQFDNKTDYCIDCGLMREYVDDFGCNRDLTNVIAASHRIAQRRIAQIAERIYGERNEPRSG